MRVLICSLLCCTFCLVYGQSEAEEQDPTVTELYMNVPVVDPDNDRGVPSDAIVLFDGTDLAAWRKSTSGSVGSMKDWTRAKASPPVAPALPVEWVIEENALIVAPSTGDIETRAAYGSAQLHIEWLAPVDEGKSGQGYSNS